MPSAAFEKCNESFSLKDIYSLQAEDFDCLFLPAVLNYCLMEDKFSGVYVFFELFYKSLRGIQPLTLRAHLHLNIYRNHIISASLSFTWGIIQHCQFLLVWYFRYVNNSTSL